MRVGAFVLVLLADTATGAMQNSDLGLLDRWYTKEFPCRAGEQLCRAAVGHRVDLLCPTAPHVNRQGNTK
jgi:hypothetical protein